ncbi:unnamed protein product [Polarella glacialis]|uniref:Palmitoyltransferase n=1 Tax=Polarella glacialis TaxID=89957 RepID=A0A813KXD6_POLGL|nr:unnamed protein product [Polarella glacialis]
MPVSLRGRCKHVSSLCSTFWATCCAERVLSPVLVLLVHGVIVADVMWHRPEVWMERDAKNRGLRLLAAATVVCYLRTTLTDPGFLRGQEAQQATGERAASSWFPKEALALLCCAAAISMAEWRARPQDSSQLPGAGTSQDHELGSLLPGQSSEGAARPGDEEKGTASPPLLPGDTQSQGIQKRRGNIEDLENDSCEGQNQRWCKRCKLYQPLRTKHCHDCGRCVRTHDHHCPWIGSCVGENNRVLFLWFLILQGTELALFFCEGVQGISLLEPSVVLLVGLLFIALFFIMVACLLSFHLFLFLTNLTTWEHASWNRITYLRRLNQDRGSPFGRSILWNATAYCVGAFWCPLPLRRLAGLRYEEDGGVIWEMAEPRPMCCVLKLCADAC